MISKVLSLVLAIALIAISLMAEQSDFNILFPLISIAFGAYFYILYKKEVSTFKFLLVVAIATRFILVFTYPNLSDDIYRFAWDGHLLLEGINPLSLLPKEVLASTSNPFYNSIFDALNSPDYYTIYPPVGQASFALASLIGQDSMTIFSIVLKSIFFITELGTLYYLIKILQFYKRSTFDSLIYALNPLIIVELCGNLHFEAIMIFFFVASFYYLIHHKLVWAGVLFGLSVCSKLLTLIFLPFLIRKLGWKKSFLFFTIVGLTCVLLFSPMLLGIGKESFGKSLNLYFQKFEFNASLYYLLRSFGYYTKGYNLIAEYGPTLAKVSLISILLLAYFHKAKHLINFPKICLFAITIYLLCTTTVHPWYLGLAIVCSVFSSFRFALLWSYLIMLSYVNYSYPEYYEPLWVVGIEYVIVIGFLIWELWKYYIETHRVT